MISEGDFKGADLRVDYILVCVGVNVFVLCYFERNKVFRHHIANHFEIGKLLSQEFGY